MIPKIRLVVTMACLWLLLSGMFKAQLLILGLMSVVLVVFLAHRMEVVEHRAQPIYFGVTRILKYWVWLVGQIVLSNIDVTKRVWSADLNIKPALKRIKASPNTEMGRVVYANSITLTPGTTTLNFTPENEVLVHALHEDSLEELEEGEMARRIRDIEPALRRPRGV